MNEQTVKYKSFVFAIRIVNLFKFLTTDKKEYVMSKQLLRSGTAIGALIREAEHAESKADFIHKMAIAQKEANESNYWLELLYETDYLEKSQYSSISKDILEIQKMSASIIITSKKNSRIK